MNRIAVFMDRDGTINEEVGYVDNFEKLRLLPMASEAIRKLNKNDIPAIMITNQSGLARGYFTLEFLNALHKRMNAELEKNGCRLNGIYICPHHPDENCACRKPKPGMLLRAAREHGITLYRSYVIGDKIIDIKLAHSVGAKGILVLTGYGAEEIKSVSQDLYDRPEHIAANLYEAINWVLEDVRINPPENVIPAKTGIQSNSQILDSCFRRNDRHLERISSETPMPIRDTKDNENRREETWGPGFSLDRGLRLKPNTQKGKRILIVKPSSLGDIIHSLPVLWMLRKIYHDAHIGWVVKEEWKDILTGNPLIDEVIVLKKGILGLLTVIRDIRKMGYNTILDLQGLFRSGIITCLSGADERIGFSTAREFAHIFYNKKIIPEDKFMHAVDRYLLTVDGITRGDFSHPEPRFPLYIEIEDSEWFREFLLENRLYNTRPIIAINPSARWNKKRWPVNSYAELINRLIHEVKAGIIILGSKEDIPIVEEISSLLKGGHAIATGKTSLRMLTALLERVDLLVTNDSGPMHIAAALETPVIALFGPTDPRLTGPYGKGHIVIKKDMDCSPCLRRPCGHGRPICMESIRDEEVLEAVKTITCQNIG